MAQRTAQSESARLQQEIEAAQGGAPSKPAEVEGTPPANPVEDTPPTPSEPVAPEPVLAAPSEPPPPPPAEPSKGIEQSPPPPPPPIMGETDWKKLYEEERAAKPRQAEAYNRLRQQSDLKDQELRTLRGLLNIKQGAHMQHPGNGSAAHAPQAPEPAAAPPAGAGLDPEMQGVPAIPPPYSDRFAAPTAVPIQPPQGSSSNPEVEKILAKYRADYGEDWVEENRIVLTGYASEIAEMAAKNVENRLRQEFGPAVQRLEATQNASFEHAMRQEQIEFDRALASIHPDWQGVIESEQFKAFLHQHSMGYIFWQRVFPPEGQVGGDVGEIDYILKEFKNSQPAHAAAQVQNADLAQRRTAAAESNVGQHPSSESDALVGDDQPMTLSQVVAMANSLVNNPEKFIEFQKRVDRLTGLGLITADPLPGDAGIPPQ